MPLSESWLLLLFPGGHLWSYWKWEVVLISGVLQNGRHIWWWVVNWDFVNRVAFCGLVCIGLATQTNSLDSFSTQDLQSGKRHWLLLSHETLSSRFHMHPSVCTCACATHTCTRTKEIKYFMNNRVQSIYPILHKQAAHIHQDFVSCSWVEAGTPDNKRT